MRNMIDKNLALLIASVVAFHGFSTAVYAHGSSASVTLLATAEVVASTTVQLSAGKGNTGVKINETGAAGQAFTVVLPPTPGFKQSGVTHVSGQGPIAVQSLISDAKQVPSTFTVTLVY